MKVITRVRLKGERMFFSVGPMWLLQNIETHASIKKATESMGMSYTKALRIIKTIEAELGFAVVESEKGGRNHGLTRLTEKGKRLISVFEEIQTEVSDYAEKLVEEKFFFD